MHLSVVRFYARVQRAQSKRWLHSHFSHAWKFCIVPTQLHYMSIIVYNTHMLGDGVRDKTRHKNLEDNFLLMWCNFRRLQQDTEQGETLWEPWVPLSPSPACLLILRIFLICHWLVVLIKPSPCQDPSLPSILCQDNFLSFEDAVHKISLLRSDLNG